jgi:predicted CXXCH cytochrome family protein
MAPMAVTPDAKLCGSCHKTTTDEWMSSKHGSTGIDCQSCHDPHAQQPKAATVTELCTNCHKEGGETFAHSTHSNAGLECSNCHMYTKPLDQEPIEGLVPTGHTFTVGSDTCIACHQDTVHSRNEIVKLEGEVSDLKTFDPEQLNQTIEEQKQEIASLETVSSNRLYTGLAQGAIIGLMMGAVSAWIVSKRMKIIEVEDNG